MPLHLEPVDVSSDLNGFNSVLIVFCPVCPPISLALHKSSPFLEPLKRGLKTAAFEDYIKSIRAPLEHRGVRTGVFSTYAPSPTMCLWTRSQRHRLLKRAKNYEAVVVLGCDTARYTAQQALEDTDCQVIQAMRMTGLTNATVKFQFPMTVRLEDKVRVGKGEEVEEVA